MSTTSIAQKDAQRKQAQEDYIVNLAAAKGITTDALETRIITDLAGGVPSHKTMTILTNMLAAARRVNGNEECND